MLLAFITLSALLWLKLSHVLTAPLNIFWESGTRSAGAAPGNRFGSEEFRGFAKSRLYLPPVDVLWTLVWERADAKLYARPTTAGKPLSPRVINEQIVKLKDFSEPLAKRTVGDEIWFLHHLRRLPAKVSGHGRLHG